MEELFFCERCERGTPGKDTCGSCGVRRAVDAKKMFFCPRCNEGRQVRDGGFCSLCGLRIVGIEKALPPLEIPAIPVKIEISRQLFFDEEISKRTDGLSIEHKLLDSALRKIREGSGDGKELEELEKRYPFRWDDLDDMSKSMTLSRGQTPGAFEGINQRGKKIKDELEESSKPLRSQIAGIIDGYLQLVLGARNVRVIKRLDSGKGFVIETNLEACGRLFGFLMDFRRRVLHSMASFSLSEIVEQVAEFESAANRIDSSLMVRQEVGDTRLRELKELIHGEPPVSNQVKAAADSLFRM